MVGRGEDTWFFITVDYTFGHSLEADAKNAVIASGGKVLGSARHPLNNPDFSSYLLQAQASGAKVVALANAGGDMINAMKQANEFGLTRGAQTLVSLLVFITDIHSIGLAAAQGIQFVTAFYWDRDDETRAWSKRFFERHRRVPTAGQAAVYPQPAITFARSRQRARTKRKQSSRKCARYPLMIFLQRTASSAKTGGSCMTFISYK